MTVATQHMDCVNRWTRHEMIVHRTGEEGKVVAKFRAYGWFSRWCLGVLYGDGKLPLQ